MRIGATWTANGNYIREFSAGQLILFIEDIFSNDSAAFSRSGQRRLHDDISLFETRNTFSEEIQIGLINRSHISNGFTDLFLVSLVKPAFVNAGHHLVGPHLPMSEYAYAPKTGRRINQSRSTQQRWNFPGFNVVDQFFIATGGKRHIFPVFDCSQTRERTPSARCDAKAGNLSFLAGFLNLFPNRSAECPAPGPISSRLSRERCWQLPRPQGASPYPLRAQASPSQ